LVQADIGGLIINVFNDSAALITPA
jgi:hypothetical protein